MILQLEMRLAEKEEKLLEKDLVFEEVSRLTERTKKKAETGKEDTLNLAKKASISLTICVVVTLVVGYTKFNQIALNCNLSIIFI